MNAHPALVQLAVRQQRQETIQRAARHRATGRTPRSKARQSSARHSLALFSRVRSAWLAGEHY